MITREMLSKILEDVGGGLGLKRVHSVDALIDEDGLNRCFMCDGTARSGILVDDHLGIEADAIIHDALLGSLGFVHILPIEDTRVEVVSREIDKAIFLRHLLVEYARSQTGGREVAPYYVEIVFVLPPDVVRQARDDFGKALRTLVERSTAINAIGVSLWQADSTGKLDGRSALRRAFSWLLREVEHWLKNPPKFKPRPLDPQLASGEFADLAKAGRLTEIELERFRTAGNRCLNLIPERRIHVVHGYNGSGKTSLAEALEYALTGWVDRIPKPELAAGAALEGPSPLEPVLVHAGTGKASITLRFRDSEKPSGALKSKVIDVGKAPPIPTFRHAGAFRLNQLLVDQLMSLGPVSAARTILEAFFPDERESLERARASQRAARTAVESLPSHLRINFVTVEGKLDAEKVRKELAWTKAMEIPWEKLREHLWLTVEQARTMESLVGGAGSAFISCYTQIGALSPEKFREAAAGIDKEYRALLESFPARRDLAKQVVDLLESLRGLQMEGAKDRRPLNELLTDWLEYSARCDLAEREHAVLCAIESVPDRQTSFPYPLPILAKLRAKPLVSEQGRETVLNDLRQQRDNARNFWQERWAESSAHEGDQYGTRKLVGHDYTVLDHALQSGLFGEAFLQADSLLSGAIRQAQHEGHVVPFSGGGQTLLKVGSAGWVDLLLDKIKPIAATIDDVLGRGGSGPAVVDPSVVFNSLKRAHDAAELMQGADEKLVETVNDLFSNNGPLLPPLNELIALLTPQRWAYEDLKSREGRGSDEIESGFDPQASGASARLILNTAEQNAFALSLFLLCAQLQPNPLRIIVLDDPFQNMDEFTVTGIARGFTRLLRLWKHSDDHGSPPWQILILIHSIENLDRLRNETACSVAMLPWLKPVATEDERVPLGPEPIAGPEERQKLAGLIKPPAIC